MRLESIIEIVAENNDPSKWVQRPDGETTISYCRENVDIRISVKVVWLNQKPFLEFQLFYHSTELLVLDLPLYGSDIAAIREGARLENALKPALEQLTALKTQSGT